MDLRKFGPTLGTAIAWLLFFGLSVTIYMRAIHGGFIWDDMYLVTDRIFRSPDALSKIWFTKEPLDYWPISYTLFRVEWLCFGLNPVGYHLVNLAIHALSCALLWRILLKLRFPYPLFISFIFCIHPINVEAVAWIFQTKTTLAAVLTLAATLFYLRLADRYRSRDYLSSLVCFLLANLAKTSAITWPLVLLGYEWYRARYQIKKESIQRLIPFFIASLMFALLSVFWYRFQSFPEAVRNDGFISRLAGAGQIVGFYFYKTLIPMNLTLVYRRWNIDPMSFVAWIPCMLIATVLLYLTLNKRYRSNRGLLLVFYVLICLFPVMGFYEVPFMRYSWVADHYFYLGLMGITAACVAFTSKKLDSSKLKVLISVLISIFYISLTVARAADYSDEKTMWKDTLKKNPSAWVAHCSLGDILAKQGKTEAATAEYLEAVEIKPDSTEARYDLGTSLFSQGKIQDAIAQYSEALRINPDIPAVHVNLGIALSNQGKLSDAIAQYTEALKVNPDFLAAHYNLGVAFSAQGEIQDAIAQYSEVLRINPDFLEARLNLGTIYANQGKIQDAIAQYSEALRIDPASPNAHYNLGTIFANQGKISDAIAQYSDALQIKPGYVEAHSNLGFAYIKLGNKQAAFQEYEILEKLNPEAANVLYTAIRQ